MQATELRLTNDEVDYVVNLAATIAETPSHNPDTYCQAVKEASHELPDRIKTCLNTFAEHGSPTGFLLIRTGLEHESLQKTPPNNKSHIGQTTLLATIQAMCISSISELIAYEAECTGHLFQDVVPTQSMAHAQTSMGSIELEIHTEQAFSKLRPDVLSLSCLRGDPEARTYILPVQSILNNLTEQEIQRLREPQWLTGVDFSFKVDGQEFIEGDVRGPMPILYGDLADPRLVFDQDLMKGTTDEAQALIRKLVAIYYKHRNTHVFVPGDIAIIDNRRAVHGRSTYHPKYDGYDRFLVRCFGVFDYARTAYARPENRRVVAARFS